MSRNWQEAEAFAHDKLGRNGKAGITQAWLEAKGELPRYVLIRGKGAKHPVTLRTFRRAGEDADLLISSTQLSRISSEEIADPLGCTIEYCKAKSLERFWYAPGKILAIIVAVTAWLAAVLTALLTFLSPSPASGQRSTTSAISSWVAYLAVAVLVVAALAATSKLVKDLREARG